MGSIIGRAKRIRRARNLTSAAALLVLNGQFVNAIFPGLGFLGWRYLCAPGFYCHSCPWATMACPLGVLVNFTTLRIVPLVALGTLALIGTFGGRIVCGWVCPFGWMQEWLHKIPGRKFGLPQWTRCTKYVVLVVGIFLIPLLWPGQPFTFCHFCPAATLTSTIPHGFIAGWRFNPEHFLGFTTRFYVRMAVLLGVLVLAILVSRGFCRLFCPLGAIFGLFNKFSLFRFNLAHTKCNNCGACAKVCPAEIDPVGQMNSAECIRCYECTNTKHIKMGVR